ncbi:hypothetical protein EDB85DRAFT_1892679 [Lactarius pseudohatsudake]|nr:hypothetical protein EDB85DRAFT_1892679 [Lactarius pseudohatsudake]
MTKAVNMKAGEEEVIARLSMQRRRDGDTNGEDVLCGDEADRGVAREITASSSATGSMSIPMLVAHAGGIIGLFDRVMQQMTGRCLCLSQRDLRLERDTARQVAVAALRQSEVVWKAFKLYSDTRQLWTINRPRFNILVTLSVLLQLGNFGSSELQIFKLLRKDRPMAIQWLFLREPEPDIMGKGDIRLGPVLSPISRSKHSWYRWCHTDEEAWVEGQLCRFPMASESPNHQANHLTVVPFVPASIPNKYWYMAYSLRQRFFNGVIYVPVAVQNPMRCPWWPLDGIDDSRIRHATRYVRMFVIRDFAGVDLVTILPQ